MKKQRKVEKDNRGVAIYARKSRITNKGDSIGVQFKQCADYAKKELGLDEEYEFLQLLQARSCRQKNSRPNPPDGFLGNVPC